MIDFSDYISNYGKEVGLPELKFDEEGICSLSFDSTINVDIVYRKEQDQCIFAAPIGDIPVEHKEEYFRRLLVANAFGLENAGAIIGLDEEKDNVVLSYTFIASTFSFDLFKTVLGNFVNMVEDWQGKLGEMMLNATDSSEEFSGDMQNFEFTRV